jgi:hypothetical protein
VETGAAGISHWASSTSRPFFAAQKWLPTTATPLASCTTWVTPGTAFTLSALKPFSRAPNAGGCATTAVKNLPGPAPGGRTSRPKRVRASTLSGPSRRRVGLPMTLKFFGSLSVTFSGTGSLPAASASCP